MNLKDIVLNYLTDNEKGLQQLITDNILSHLRGQTVTQEKIKNYCIESTAFPTFWSSSLKILEESEKISVTNRNRKGSYPPGCVVSFKS
jgi:hypothetical protein